MSDQTGKMNIPFFDSEGMKYCKKFFKAGEYAYHKGATPQLLLLSTYDNDQLDKLGRQSMSAIEKKHVFLRFIKTGMETKTSLILCKPDKSGSMRVFSVEHEYEYPPITKDDSGYYKLMLSYMEL